MAVALSRASVFAIKEEVTAGTYLPPSGATSFVPLRPGNETNYEPEKLSNEELLNDIGNAKDFTGKEKVSGSHNAYLRHSGVEGQEPQLGILYESLMGTKTVYATEYPTVASSTTSLLKVNTGIGANFAVGQAVLIKKPAGYEIRNIASISGDDLTLNFKTTDAPLTGINLGKCVLYSPASTGHKTFSTTKYIGDGYAVEASAGNTVTEISFKMDANGFGDTSFSYEGTNYYFNPITITSSTKYLDVTDDTGTFAVAITEGVYKTPVELADTIAAALDASSTETYTVAYSSITGKFTIASGSTVLSLLWNTGTNTANSIATKIGFTTVANSTAAVTYTSANAQTYTKPYTPTYDSSDAIIIKGAQLFIGGINDNVEICAQTVSLKISKTVEDVDCITSTTGVSEKIATKRATELSVEALLTKYDVSLLDALLNNDGISAMMNAGPKSGGNWVAGKCFNLYMQKATVASYKTVGDSFVQVSIVLKGYVTTTEKDIYFSFI